MEKAISIETRLKNSNVEGGTIMRIKLSSPQKNIFNFKHHLYLELLPYLLAIIFSQHHFCRYYRNQPSKLVGINNFS